MKKIIFFLFFIQYTAVFFGSHKVLLKDFNSFDTSPKLIGALQHIPEDLWQNIIVPYTGGFSNFCSHILPITLRPQKHYDLTSFPCGGDIIPNTTLRLFMRYRCCEATEVVDIQTGKVITQNFGVLLQAIKAMSHDQKKIIVQYKNRSTIQVHDFLAEQFLCAARHKPTCWLPQFTRDDRSFIANTGNKKITLHDALTGKSKEEFKHKHHIKKVELSKDGKKVIIVDSKSKTVFWNIEAHVDETIGHDSSTSMYTFGHEQEGTYLSDNDGKRIALLPKHRQKSLIAKAELLHKGSEFITYEDGREFYYPKEENGDDGLPSITVYHDLLLWDTSVANWEITPLQILLLWMINDTFIRTRHASFRHMAYYYQVDENDLIVLYSRLPQPIKEGLTKKYGSIGSSLCVIL